MRNKTMNKIKMNYYVHPCKYQYTCVSFVNISDCGQLFQNTDLFFTRVNNPVSSQTASNFKGKATVTLAMTGRRGLCNVSLSSKCGVLSTKFGINV